MHTILAISAMNIEKSSLAIWLPRYGFDHGEIVH